MIWGYGCCRSSTGAIPQKAFARLLHTTPQNLTDLLRGGASTARPSPNGKARCQGVLDMLDRQSPDTAVPTGCRARLSGHLLHVEDVTLGKYDTYGLQCLCHQSDAWVQIRVIRDISTYRSPSCTWPISSTPVTCPPSTRRGRAGSHRPVGRRPPQWNIPPSACTVRYPAQPLRTAGDRGTCKYMFILEVSSMAKYIPEPFRH
jgi:hypothetical protein